MPRVSDEEASPVVTNRASSANLQSMLRRLKFRNFKSWDEVSLDFGQITGLFGTNSNSCFS